MYTAGEESGDQEDDFIYAELISNGYAARVLSSADEIDLDAANYLRGIIYNPGEVRGNADPRCLNITEISASCKCVVAADPDTNTALVGSKDAFPPNYIYKRSVNSKCLRGEMSKIPINLTLIFGKGYRQRCGVVR